MSKGVKYTENFSIHILLLISFFSDSILQNIIIFLEFSYQFLKAISSKQSIFVAIDINKIIHNETKIP